jgi:hypothetical protein
MPEALRSKTMSTNDEMNKMHAQILNLRSAGITLATAIHHFPPCGRPGSCNHKCPEARDALKEIYHGMKRLLFLTRSALDAVLRRDPEHWDFMCDSIVHEQSLDKFLSNLGEQEELIRYWGTMDSHLAMLLGENFSRKEWEVLAASAAWQNQRPIQITNILTGIEDGVIELLDLFDSVIYSGLLGNCNLGQWAAQRKAAQA